MQRGGDKDKDDGGSKTDTNATFIPVSSTQDKALKMVCKVFSLKVKSCTANLQSYYHMNLTD